MSRMSGPEDMPLVDLYSLGHVLKKFKMNAFNAMNFPDEGHLVIFRVAFPHLSSQARKKVEEIIVKAGMTPVLDKMEHEIFFAFPEDKSATHKRKLGDFEQADLMEVLREVEDANFFIHGLTSLRHDEPPIEHVTFTITFHGVDPAGRQPVEDILTGHGFAIVGGGTFLGDPPESDVQFWWSSTRKLYMKKVGRE